MADRLLLESSDVVLLESSDAVLLEGQDLTLSFIASATVLYDPTLVLLDVGPPFIASVTVVRAPTFSGSGIYTFDANTTWVCPDGVYDIKVECRGGGGGGQSIPGTNAAQGGGGGGAYAEHGAVPVTPGNTYTITIGAGGGVATTGGSTTFVGDSSTTVTAVGGTGCTTTASTGGAGGLASASTGQTKFNGGNGGNGAAIGGTGGAGGGEGAGSSADGHNGTNSVGFNTNGQAGGTGGNGGDGGKGADYTGAGAFVGQQPGGGGGGGAFSTTGAAGAAGRIQITVYPNVDIPFVASTTAVYALDVVAPYINVPFIASATAVYALTVSTDADVNVPFIGSTTAVFAISAIWQESTAPGNGGETFLLQLAPVAAGVTATLATSIDSAATSLTLTADSGLPASGEFCLTLDTEVLSVTPTGSHTYRIVRRGLSNTLTAAHAASVAADWTDSYDMAVEATEEIGGTVIVDGDSYDAWLIAFDSSQAYLAGDHYPTFVDELVGVYPPGTGTGTNKLDASQPTAAHAPAATSEDCPVGITVPARLVADIEVGDVALLRYTNTEAGVLTLGPRSTAVQSWYGFMRVDGTNVDVTDTDPSGNIVDGSVDAEFFDESFITATIPGTDRTFTYGPPHYSDKGWPIAALAVRQDMRRVPLWTSPDWHQFSYVYSGFGTDATFVQILINRNGFDPFDPEPTFSLPGPEDLSGPNATWDDDTYHSSAAWYVGIFKAPVLLAGPILNPGPPAPPYVPPSPTTTIIPGVPSGPGGGSTTTPPEPGLEGGSGGDINPPVGPAVGERHWAAFV